MKFVKFDEVTGTQVGDLVLKLNVRFRESFAGLFAAASAKGDADKGARENLNAKYANTFRNALRLFSKTTLN